MLGQRLVANAAVSQVTDVADLWSFKDLERNDDALFRLLSEWADIIKAAAGSQAAYVSLDNFRVKFPISPSPQLGLNVGCGSNVRAFDPYGANQSRRPMRCRHLLGLRFLDRSQEYQQR
jgi:hypothetical protein